MPAIIEAMRKALVAYSRGEIEVRQRTRWDIGDFVMLVQAAASRDLGLAVVKVVTLAPPSIKDGKAAVQGSLAILDYRTGAPLARLDAEAITALRTGACSAVATDLFAPAGAKTLAVFGTGPEGLAQIEGVCAVRPVERVLLYGRDYVKTSRRAEEFEKLLRVAVHAQRSLEHLGEAEIVCTATSATSPLFGAEDLRPEVHVNAIGAYRPDMCELPSDLLREASLFVDSAQFCATESGDLLRAFGDPIEARKKATELGQALLQPRHSRPRRTVYKSVGNAAQDLYAAVLFSAVKAVP